MPISLGDKLNLNTQADPVEKDIGNVLSLDTGDAADKKTSIGSGSGKTTATVGVMKGSLLDKKKLGTKLDQSLVTRKTTDRTDVRTMLTVVKPTIIACLQFLPAFSNNGEEKPVARMIDLQTTSRNLAIDDVAHMISEAKGDDVLSSHIDSLTNEYLKDLTDERQRLTFLGQILSRMEDAKDALDLKKSDKNVPDMLKKKREARKIGVIPGTHNSFREIVTCHLRFSDKSYESFSNSRVALQLLSDLRMTLDEHSPQLLTTYSEKRNKDVDPVNLDVLPVRDEKFTFSRKLISSDKVASLKGDSFDPKVFSDFKEFIRSLPSDEVSRIKLLSAFLSKELRISAGIERFRNEKVGKSVDVIGKVIGPIGKSITDVSGNPSGMSATVKLKDEQGNFVLPLERRPVQTSDGTVFIPGTFHLVEGILESDKRPDLSQFTKYAADVTSALSEMNTMIEDLLNLNDEVGLLTCASVMETFMSPLSDQLSSISKNVSKSTGTCAAILNMSQGDEILRHLVYRYVREMRTGVVNTSKTKVASDDDTGSSEKGSQSKQKASTGKQSSSFVSSVSKAEKDFRPLSGGDNVISNGNSFDVVIKGNNIPELIENRVNGTLTKNKGKVLLTPSGNTKLKISKGEISDIIENASKDPKSLFQLIVNVFESLLSASEKLANGETSSEAPKKDFRNESGLTHNSKIDEDTLLMVAFEIVASFVNEFFSASFSDTIDKSHDTITVVINSDQNTALCDKARRLTGKKGLTGVTVQFRTLEGLLESIVKGLNQEDDIVRDICDALLSFFSGISDASKSLESFFDTKSDSDAAKKMKNILSNQKDIDAVRRLTKAQNASSWYAAISLTETRDDSFFPESQIIGASKKNALTAMLREASFGDASTNARILFVGLPAGTLESLRNPIFSIGKDKDISSNNADVVSLNVYRRDPQQSEIIYKPLRFTFDMSRYFDPTFEADDGINFTDFLDKVAGLHEISGLKGLGKVEKLNEILENSEYKHITSDQRISLIKNHAVDYLLKTYAKLLTGMDLDDYAFVVNEDVVTSTPASDKTKFSLKGMFSAAAESQSSTAKVMSLSGKLVDNIGKGDSVTKVTLTKPPLQIGGQRIVLVDEEDNQKQIKGGKTGTASDAVAAFDRNKKKQKQAEDYFKKMIGSLLFSMQEHRSRTESIKSFDRIFAVLVDPDDFAVDNDMMLKSSTGRETLKMLSHRDDAAKISEDFTFSEYFVTVDLGRS